MALQQKDSLYWKLLVAITDQMSLPQSKFEDAEGKYLAVARWLADSGDGHFAKTDIYPQGSMRLGTTIKPYNEEEFDIDLVAHLPNITMDNNPNVIRNLIGKRLLEHGYYKTILEPLNRGWRLNYAGDFHMDITPSIPNTNTHFGTNPYRHDAEYVPDKKLQDWKDSNPKGFAKWFDEIDKIMPVSISNENRGLAFDANIEMLPSAEAFKGFLKRSIQLFKRHRDVYFAEKNKELTNYKPISILLTTMTANLYKDLVQGGISASPIELLKIIIRNLPNRIKTLRGEYWVENPTNAQENFAEKWNTDKNYYTAFKLWQESLYNDIEDILKLEGLNVVGNRMNDFFGQKYVTLAMESLNHEVANSRANGLLAGGIISSHNGLSSNVAKNTFYGSEQHN
ncbi:nucleotidyltransferase domain-containing protein [Sulfurospirillum arsenophilum]|uniref:nucleotidyltransferase domain-containing protein n=1 Tax=Sulfurospirillum arsenophilum TaxID=56698 RepID=UPI0005A81546|nr:nucleotidyltransferase [Sulfurospirillum arsenophilum]